MEEKLSKDRKLLWKLDFKGGVVRNEPILLIPFLSRSRQGKKPEFVGIQTSYVIKLLESN